MEIVSNKMVSVVIVTAGLKDYLWRCLESVRRQSYPAGEIIVIDNSCNNQFSQKVASLWPDVKLFINTSNLFYCQALNQGIHVSRGEFILCLNDDVILDPGFIKECMGGFLIDSQIGMVSGKILRSEGKTIDTAGLFLSPWRTAKERGYSRRDAGCFERDEYIFGVNGAVAFYRKGMLEEIKIDAQYFDEDYRIFYEDLDIAWRAKNCGWRAYYIHNAIAYHVRGATVRGACGLSKPFARIYLNRQLNVDLAKNRYLTIIKNETFLGFLSHIHFILFYDLFILSYLLLFRPLVFKDLIFSVKYLKSAFKKRKLIRNVIFTCAATPRPSG